MAKQEKLLKSRESRVSTVIIGLLFVVAGFLVYSYFQEPQDEFASDVTPTKEVETVLDDEEESQNGEVSDDNEQDESTPEDQITYTVKEGDTLWEIAQDKLGSGFEWKELAEVNNIPLDNPTLEIGEELIVGGFGGPEKEGDVLSAVSAEKDNGQVVVTEKYSIQEGDTLWEIAEKFYGEGEKWTKIFNAPENNLSMYTAKTTGETYPLVHTGNVLIIPQVSTGQ